ncbi:Mitochondrial import receptor subunit TOM22 like protein [Myotis brandtii]|uniref:Mitochondrial import receptor subunit TOM22 homolog n=1 Tax=Myotis brandtii TaxID=109478 RepID=S7NL79_MYOBR|nr:Mitochondrial import receptor subunit TOM22 like protein [Myotis brandtii]
MAAIVAAPGPGAPLPPDEMLPKGDTEKTEEELEEDDDDEPDETLSERLWGLTEMFPERIRSAAGATFDLSLFVAQKMYRFSRAALWIGTTSFMILVLPVVFETEKLQMEQQQQLQQRQILLGPNVTEQYSSWPLLGCKVLRGRTREALDSTAVNSAGTHLNSHLAPSLVAFVPWANHRASLSPAFIYDVEITACVPRHCGCSRHRAWPVSVQ